MLDGLLVVMRRSSAAVLNFPQRPRIFHDAHAPVIEMCSDRRCSLGAQVAHVAISPGHKTTWPLRAVPRALLLERVGRLTSKGCIRNKAGA